MLARFDGWLPEFGFVDEKDKDEEHKSILVKLFKKIIHFVKNFNVFKCY